MHQYRFIRTVGKIDHADMNHRLLTMLDIGKVEAVLVNTYLTDKIGMRLGKVLDFLYYFTIELQIDQIGLRIAVNSHGFLEMPQCLGVKSHIHRSFCPRSNRRFCPLSYGAGTIRLHFCKH